MRCINIDWLEVYCFENKAIPRDMEYFKKQGYVVKKRDYGTPQYKEVLTHLRKGYGVRVTSKLTNVSESTVQRLKKEFEI